MASRLLLGLCLAAAAWPAAAQELRPTDERRSNAPGYYYYVLPGERTTQATVLGTVRAPGFYEVSAGTDLAELLALAGGPVLGPLSSDVDREVTITLSRSTPDGRRDVIYRASAEEFAATDDALPVLRDGDRIEVATLERRRWNWRDTLTIVGGAASVVIAVVQIIQAVR